MIPRTVEHRRKLSKARIGKYMGFENPRFKNIMGDKYGKLTVLEYKGSKNGKGSLWLCKCDCGGEKIADTSHLRNGHTISCGCLHYKTGKDNPNWKGTGYFSKGYKYIYNPNHPNAIKNYVAEHTFIMSQYLGRKLEKGEIVHHKNGNKKDNRLNNLELRTFKSHPPGQSISQLIEYAIDILQKYSPDKLSLSQNRKQEAT